jgi:hypothetical protein
MASKQSDADTPNTPVNTLGYYLVVRHAFGDYRKGDAIRDPEVIAAVTSGDNASSVHKVIE